MFTITIKITMQISVKIKSFYALVKSKQRSTPEKFLCKRQKKKKKRSSYWVLNKAFIHNSEPFSSY